MPLSEKKKAWKRKKYRENREEILAYHRAHRREAGPMEKDRIRSQKRRSTPNGRDLNQKLVRENVTKLGRMYVGRLIATSLGISQKGIPDDAIEMKREQIQLARLSREMQTTAQQEIQRNEIKNHDSKSSTNRPDENSR